MPGAYLIVLYDRIGEPEKLAPYAELAAGPIQAAGGKIIAKDTPAKAYEAGSELLSVVVSFDSVDAAIGLYESPDYKKALEALGPKNIRDVRILKAS
jgi:uncharacterized protein (DUF1330 family)